MYRTKRWIIVTRSYDKVEVWNWMWMSSTKCGVRWMISRRQRSWKTFQKIWCLQLFMRYDLRGSLARLGTTSDWLDRSCVQSERNDSFPDNFQSVADWQRVVDQFLIFDRVLEDEWTEAYVSDRIRERHEQSVMHEKFTTYVMNYVTLLKETTNLVW